MKSLVFLFMTLISMTVSAQAQDTVLIYVTRTNNEYFRTFLYSTETLNSYSIFTVTSQPVEPTICGAVSPNGMFDAFTQLASPTELSFLYMPTNEIFAIMIWNSDWDPCKLEWLDNETLVARQVDTFDVVAMFKIQNNILQEVPISLPPTPILPELPFAYNTLTPESLPSWSPDNRYFWYSSINEEGFDNFRVYDTVLEQPLETGGFNWTLDLFQKPVWSSDSRYVAFWQVGLPEYDKIDPTMRSVNVYDTVTQHVISLDLGIKRDSGRDAVVWSPNAREFVVRDLQGNLYRVNVESRSYELIDINVMGVIAWSYVEPIPEVALSVPKLPANPVNKKSASQPAYAPSFNFLYF